MEGWKLKLIAHLVTLALGGLGVHKYYAEKIIEMGRTHQKEIVEQTQEIDSLRHQIDTTHQSFSGKLDRAHQQLKVEKEEVRKLNSALDSQTQQLRVLQEKYEDLMDKFRRVTKADGIEVKTSSIKTSWQRVTVTTGDNIEFKLSSASLSLQIVRVTDQGPIVQLPQKTPYNLRLADSAFVNTKDGNNAYLLRSDTVLHLQASSKPFIVAKLWEIENIYVSCKSFHVYPPQALLEYRQNLGGD